MRCCFNRNPVNKPFHSRCNKTVQVTHVSNYDICPVLRSDIYCGEISADMNVKLAVNYVLNDQLNSQSLEDKEKQTECI